MKLKYIRWIDRYTGIIICSLLFLFEKLSACLRLRRRRSLDSGSIAKILIIKFWGFGSITLAFDFFQVIRNAYPKARIYALTLKQNKPIYEISGLFDEVIDIDLKGLPKFLSDSARAIANLRSLSFDAAFDLEFTSRFSAIVTCLINAKKRIGFRYPGIWRGSCFTDTIEFREDIKLKESFLKLSSLIVDNPVPPEEPVRLNIGSIQRDFIENLLTEEGLNGVHPLVGVNINASELCLLRRWPKEYFASLVNELISKYRARIIFIGDKNDAQYVNQAMENIPLKDYARNFAGKISLSQLAYLLTKLDLFISNDSGPLHLAAYLKIATISFFGPETPLIYGPQGKNDVVFYKKTDCSPCIRIKNYKHSECIINNRCLREIKPSEVISEIERKRIL